MRTVPVVSLLRSLPGVKGWLAKSQPSAAIAGLRRVPAFRGCSDRELAEVCRLVDEVSVEVGHTLIAEGTVARQAFVILEGLAGVMVGGMQVASLGPGELAGEVAMLDRGSRTATVVAHTPMRLLAIGPGAFGDFARTPAAATAISRTLAARLRRADDQLASASGGTQAEGQGKMPTHGDEGRTAT